jgi:hypothetical protein
LNKNFITKNVNARLFDENERGLKGEIIIWNKNNETLFCIDKKKSQSKKFKRIEYHLIPKSERGNLDDSGCERNIKKGKKEKNDEYINNSWSRIIKKRKEGEFIKLYETLRNTISKNEIFIEMNKEEILDEEYNIRIELIDKLVEANEVIINSIKHNLWEREDEFEMKVERYLILDAIIVKRRVGEGHTHKFIIAWIIRDGLEMNSKESRFNLLVNSNDDMRSIYMV